MRNILIPIIILTLIILFLIINILIINNDTQKLDSLLVNAKQAAENGDYKESLKIVDEFHKELSTKKSYFQAVINHNEIDLIIQSSEKLESFCTEKTKEEFLAECSVLIELFQHIMQSQIPTLDNII